MGHGFSWFRLPWWLQGNSCIQQLHLQAGSVDRAPGDKVEDLLDSYFQIRMGKTNQWNVQLHKKDGGLVGGFKYFLCLSLFGEDF